MKFRVIGDMHVDINAGRVPEFGDDVFTVVCGDTSGQPGESVEWIRKNFRRGVCVSGNHLPYNDQGKTIGALRRDLASAFGPDGDFTYLDALTGTVSKVVDGVLFVGSCLYSDMKIRSGVNPEGDRGLNMLISGSRMNDFRFGLTEDFLGEIRKIRPDDYVEWNRATLAEFDRVLGENEHSGNPLPAVVVTHYPMSRRFAENSLYVDRDNFPSYANDMEEWFSGHPSVRCHCCGHCHDIPEKDRSFVLKRAEMPDVLMVNNSFGYFRDFHDLDFRPNLFVDTETWTVSDAGDSSDYSKDKERRRKDLKKMLSFFT